MPENSYIWSAYNSTTDGFLIVGGFNEFGIAEGTIEQKIGKVREIRLHVHTDSENWAIISEVSYLALAKNKCNGNSGVTNVWFENFVLFIFFLQIHLQDTTAQ